MRDLHDVIVVGAGPGGSAVALQLAREGLDVLLLDKQAFPRDKTCGDALNPRVVGIFRSLGIPELLPTLGYQIDGISVTTPSGAHIQAPITINGDPGYVIRRIDLDEGLRAAAVAAGAEFVGDVRVTQVVEEDCRVVGGGQRSPLEWHGRVILLAVGANVGLLKPLGLLPSRPEFAYAARLYFEGLRGLRRQIEFRFDGVPLPGYGWIFPLSESTANVGAGLYGHARRTAYDVLQQFLRHGPIVELLGDGHAPNQPKAYPLRTDFHRSPARRGRLLLIGEAAGLVNPFSGEGIDYALESAVLAGECLRDCFAKGDLSEQALSRYERKLRVRFQRVFVLTSWMRRVYMNERLLDALGRACVRWPDLTRLFFDILLTREDPMRAFAPKVMLRILRSLPVPP